MNLKIELKRTVKVECYRVLGTVSRAQKRDELHAILQLAQEQNDVVTASDVAKYLLNLPEIVAERLLNICKQYKLLEWKYQKYHLTDSGREALEKEQLFIPEYGTWVIWITCDPLLPSLLMIKSEKDINQKNGRKNGNGNGKSFNRLPKWFDDLKELKSLIPIDDKISRLDNFEPKVEYVDSTARLEIKWTLNGSGEHTFSLNGQISGKSVNLSLDPSKIAFTEIWHELLKQNGMLTDNLSYWNRVRNAPAWDVEHQVLCVQFDDLSDREKGEMHKTLQLNKCNFENYGTFDPTAVERIPIYPFTEEDANEWAEWRLEQSIRSYVTEEQYELKRQEAIKPFSEFNLTLLTRFEFAQAIFDQSIEQDNPPIPRYWHLQAPIDWNL